MRVEKWVTRCIRAWEAGLVTEESLSALLAAALSVQSAVNHSEAEGRPGDAARTAAVKLARVLKGELEPSESM